MNGTLELGLPSAGSKSPVGSLSLISIVRVLGLDGQHEGHQLLADGVVSRPAPDRGGAVLGRDGLAVVPLQAIAQRERVGELVRGHLGPVDHLRPDLAVGVGGEQSVVDHVAVVADDEGRVPERIEDLQIGVHDDAQHRLGCGHTGTSHQRRGGRQPRHRRVVCNDEQEYQAGSWRFSHHFWDNATATASTQPTVAGAPIKDNFVIATTGGRSRRPWRSSRPRPRRS